MPIKTGVKRARSKALTMARADKRETSCSALRPPKRMATVFFWVMASFGNPGPKRPGYGGTNPAFAGSGVLPHPGALDASACLVGGGEHNVCVVREAKASRCVGLIMPEFGVLTSFSCSR